MYQPARVAERTYCSLSMSISFSSKSLWRSWLGLSNRNVTESPVSSACNQRQVELTILLSPATGLGLLENVCQLAHLHVLEQDIHLQGDDVIVPGALQAF